MTLPGGPLRFGLVGAGAIAQTWAQAFRATDKAVLTAVADPRAPLAEAMAEQADALAFSSADELARSGACDAAVVCAPPATHADIALSLIAAGVHVLCEKPLAPDCPSARKMVTTAGDAGLLLTMASKFRFVEDMVRARSIVASGLLGDVVLFSNSFLSRTDMRARWNADPSMSGGGVIIDNGTHSVDIARYLLGPIAEVWASEGTRVQGLPVEDTARIQLRSEGGALGMIQLSWAVENSANSYVEVIGTDGVLRVGWSRSRFRQGSSPQWIDFGSGYDKVAAHSRQLDVFAAAVRGTGELLVSPQDALASVAVIEAAYRSAAGGAWVAVDEAC